MAYQYQKKEDDTNEQGSATDGGVFNQTSDGSFNLTSTGDSSAVVGGGGGRSKGGGSGSGWTNLQDYVGANEGESERTAQNVVGDISGKRKDTTEKVTSFGDTEISGYDKADDTFLDDLRGGRSGRGQEASSLYNQDWTGPDDVTKVAGYEDTFNAYKDFDRYNDVLDDPYKITEQYNPGGNIGEKNLDRFFYEQNPAQKLFAEETQAGTQVDDLWNQSSSAIDDRIASEREGFGDQKQAMQDAFDTGLTGFTSQFNPAYNTDYVRQLNQKRDDDFRNFMAGVGGDTIGGSIGDYEYNLGKKMGYDFNRMFDDTGDLTLGDFIDPSTGQAYRDYIGDYGETFGATDILGDGSLTPSGTRGRGFRTGPDVDERNALIELGTIYNKRENDRGYNQQRYDDLLRQLGIEGFVDDRTLPPPVAAAAPADPGYKLPGALELPSERLPDGTVAPEAMDWIDNDAPITAPGASIPYGPTLNTAAPEPQPDMTGGLNVPNQPLPPGTQPPEPVNWTTPSRTVRPGSLPNFFWR